MKRKALLHLPLFLAVILAFTHTSYAQLVAGPGVTDATLVAAFIEPYLLFLRDNPRPA